MNENQTISEIWQRSSERNLVSAQHWARMADKYKLTEPDLSGFASIMAKSCLEWAEADAKTAERFRP